MEQEEALLAAKRQEIIHQRWTTLLQYQQDTVTADSDFETFKKELAIQKQLCTEVLRQKEKILKAHQRELAEKDDEYSKAIARYGQEIEDLLTKMRIDIKALQEQYDVRTI